MPGEVGWFGLVGWFAFYYLERGFPFPPGVSPWLQLGSYGSSKSGRPDFCLSFIYVCPVFSGTSTCYISALSVFSFTLRVLFYCRTRLTLRRDSYVCQDFINPIGVAHLSIIMFLLPRGAPKRPWLLRIAPMVGWLVWLV